VVPWLASQIGKELWAVVRSPVRGWSTLLLLAPGGTGAAQSLLPAIASHYGVGTSGVMWMNGVAGGAMLALGSLTGAVIPIGTHGLLWTDAGANLLVFGVVAAVFMARGLGLRRVSPQLRSEVSTSRGAGNRGKWPEKLALTATAKYY
jgi:hypothetical protein